jgi:hypothetical protein
MPGAEHERIIMGCGLEAPGARRKGTQSPFRHLLRNEFSPTPIARAIPR